MSIRIEGNAGAATMGGGFELRNFGLTVLAILGAAGALAAIAMSGDTSGALETDVTDQGAEQKQAPNQESDDYKCDLCSFETKSGMVYALHRAAHDELK